MRMYGGTFNGGGGTDHAWGVWRGTFYGDGGNDYVEGLHGVGTFDGGPGMDTMETHVAGTCISFELGDNADCTE